MFFWCEESALAQAEDRVQGTAKKFESRMQLRIYASWQEKKKIHVDTFLMRSKVLWVCWELHERLLWLVIKVRTFLGEKNGAFQAFIVQLYFNIAKKKERRLKIVELIECRCFFFVSFARFAHPFQQTGNYCSRLGTVNWSTQSRRFYRQAIRGGKKERKSETKGENTKPIEIGLLCEWTQWQRHSQYGGSIFVRFDLIRSQPNQTIKVYVLVHCSFIYVV